MYSLIITSVAGDELARLERRISDTDFERLMGAIKNLINEPRPYRVLKLHGKRDTYRIRVGDYRVIYEISDKELLVLIVRVSRRNESTYRY